MLKTRHKVIIVLILILTIIHISLTACNMEWGNHVAESIRGDITGNTYTIDTFDNNGDLTLKTHGSNISISYNTYREKTYSRESGWGYVEGLSSVISMTIDGHEMDSCGDTCIFYEDGLTPDYYFYLDMVEASSEGVIFDNALFTKSINKVKNFIGKPMVIIIKSQTGVPIYVFSGDSVYWEVCEDLPKTTKISIDGKAMYIHRANFQLIDKALIE